MRLCPSKTLFWGVLLPCVEFEPFERLTASVTLSAADGLIIAAEHVELLGFRSAELIGKKNIVTDVVLEGATMERTFISKGHDPVLTLMSVHRADSLIKLHFEIVDHRYALEFVLEADGTILDCNRYASTQLTGHSRHQLVGASVNNIVPGLFPSFPVGDRFACQAVHREGHVFRVNVIMFGTWNGQYFCQMRRHVSCLSAEHGKPIQLLNDVQVAGLQLGAVLGVGSFGIVQLGTLSDDRHRHVAVKFIAKDCPTLALQEAEILEHFHHENIVQLYAVLETPQYHAIVMELCPGVEMSYYVVSRPVLMTTDEARHYVWQLVSAVSYIHAAGVVHRDISLDNIMVHAFGKTSLHWRTNSIKLIDFGLSCKVKLDQLLDTFCGSPAFASPEVLQQRPYDGFAADVWSIGIVLYCILVGHLPFACVSEIVSNAMDMSRIADKICLDLLEKLLTKGAKRRVKLSQIVAHPWLEEYSKLLGKATEIDEDKFETPTKRIRIDSAHCADFPASLMEGLKPQVLQ